MIKELKKHVGYICPYCSSITIKPVNIFDLSGAHTELACSDKHCGDTCLSITTKKDKYTISVDCPICDGTHTFNIQKHTFWSNRFFKMKCPETAFGILFVGTEDEVKTEIELQEEILTELNDDIPFGDEFGILYGEFERISELASSNNISCKCGSRTIAIEINEENVTLACRECGRKLEIPATHEALDELLNTSAIVLD